MKIICQTLMLITVKATCADSGVNPSTITEVDGNCFNEGSFAVHQKGKAFDCDGNDTLYSNFHVPLFTPINTTCSISSYTLSKTPLIYSTLPELRPSPCSDGNATYPICLQDFSSTIHCSFYNKNPFYASFYYCAVFNDGSIYCHPQEHGIVIQCNSALGMQYTTSLSTIDFVFQPNEVKVIDFSLQINQVFQNTDACLGVVMNTYGVYKDSSLNTLFTDDAMFQLTDSTIPSSTKMTVTSSTPLNFQTFYIIAANRLYDKTKSEILAINIFICGFESIQFWTPPSSISVSFTAGTNVQTLDHSTESGLLLSSFASCPVNTYEVITDQTTGALLGGTAVTVDAQNIYIDTSQLISSQLWLRVSTSGRGGHYDIPLMINIICGPETIQFSPSAPTAITEIYVKGTGSHMLDFSGQTSLISSSIPACPIISFDITTDQAGTLYIGSQVSLQSQNVITDSITSFNSPLFIRAQTTGGASYYIPLNIQVLDQCGFETIIASPTPPTVLLQTYAKGIGNQYIDHTPQTSLLSSSHSACPIQTREIITDQALGTSLGGFPVSVDATNIITDTSAGFNSPLWLRSYTKGGVYYDIPLKIIVCGFETILASQPTSSFDITYQRFSVMENLDHTPQTSLLSSSNAVCPIQSYDIITDQVAGTSLGGTPISVDSTYIITQTSSPFSIPLWLRTFTIGGVNYDIPLNIYICGFETIITSSNPSALEATYQKGIGSQSLEHSPQTSLLLSSHAGCPIQSYDIITDQVAGTSLGGTPISVDSTSVITDTMDAFNTPLWLRAFTSGGAFYDISLDIVVCDDQVIGSVDSSVIIQEIYALNSGIQSYDISNIQEVIKPAGNRCPIVMYDIVDQNFSPYVNQKLKLSANLVISDTSDQVAVNYEKFYLRACMVGSSIEIFVPIDFHFCGAELVIVDQIEDNKQIQFAIGSGVRSNDITNLLQKLRSSDPKCPVIKFELYNKDKLQSFMGPQNIKLSKNSLLVDTQSEFKLILQIKASTRYGKVPNFVPLTVEVQRTQSSCQQPNLDGFDLIEIKCTPNPIMHPDLFQFASSAQYEIGSTLVNDTLVNLLNLDSDLLGKNTSLKNDMSTAISFEVKPPLGKQIIKFDKVSQSIYVASYDERFAGIYKCSFIVVSERRIRTVNFEINFTNLNFKRAFIDEKEQINQLSKENGDIKTFFGKITKIDEKGEVSIKFSEPFNNPNITLFNQSMKLYIQPAPLTYDALENQDPKAIYEEIQQRRLIKSSEFLNFTWKAINMTEQEMNFKISFMYPFNVSTSDNLRDQLVIQIEDPMQFRSKKMSFLDNNLMIWPIRRQLPDDEFVNQIMTGIEIFTDGLEYSTIFTFITNLYVMLWLNQIAQAFQHLNIILSQTMINIQSPSNVIFFLLTIKQITNAEILQSWFTLELLLNFDKEDELMNKIKQEDDRDNLLNDHLIDMGYENFSPIQNLGGIIYSIAFYIILLISGFLIKIAKICLEKLFPKFQQKALLIINRDQDLIIIKAAKLEEEIKERTLKALVEKRMKSQQTYEGGEITKAERRRLKEEKILIREQRQGRKIIWKFYIKLIQLSKRISELLMFQFMFTVVTESFTTMLISGILWWERVYLARKYLGEDYGDDVTERINDVVGVILLLLVTVITIIYFLMVSVISLDRVNTVTFKQYIGFILERLKMENRLQLLYNFWYTLRRLIIVLISLFMQNYTGIQLMLFMTLNLSSLIYIGLVRPFKGKTLNQNELLSEFSTSIITIIEVCFTQFAPDPQHQFTIGWVFIAIIILCIIFFQVFIFRQILRYAKLLCLRECCGVDSSKSKEDEQNKQQNQEELKEENKEQTCNILENYLVQINIVRAQQKMENQQNHQLTFGEITQNDTVQKNECDEIERKKQRKITISVEDQIPQNIFLFEESRCIKENKVIQQNHTDKENLQLKEELEQTLLKDLESQSVEEIKRRMEILESGEKITPDQEILKILQQNIQLLNDELNSRLHDQKQIQQENFQREEEQEQESLDEWNLRSKPAQIPNQVFSSSSSERHIYSQPKKQNENFSSYLDDIIAGEQPSFGIKKQDISIDSDSQSEEEKQEYSSDSDSGESGEIIPENLEIKEWLYNETLGRSEMPEFCMFDFVSKRHIVNKEKIKICLPPFISGLQKSIEKMDYFLENCIMTDMQRIQLESLIQIYNERLEEKMRYRK